MIDSSLNIEKHKNIKRPGTSSNSMLESSAAKQVEGSGTRSTAAEGLQKATGFNVHVSSPANSVTQVRFFNGAFTGASQHQSEDAGGQHKVKSGDSVEPRDRVPHAANHGEPVMMERSSDTSSYEVRVFFCFLFIYSMEYYAHPLLHSLTRTHHHKLVNHFVLLLWPRPCACLQKTIALQTSLFSLACTHTHIKVKNNLPHVYMRAGCVSLGQLRR
jgi:hypothetical protein